VNKAFGQSGPEKKRKQPSKSKAVENQNHSRCCAKETVDEWPAEGSQKVVATVKFRVSFVSLGRDGRLKIPDELAKSSKISQKARRFEP